MPDFEILQQPDALQIPLDTNWIIRRKGITRWDSVTDTDVPIPPGTAARGYLARKVVDDTDPANPITTYDLIDPALEVAAMTARADDDFWGRVPGTSLRAHLDAGEVIYEVVEIGDAGEYRDVVELLVVESATPEIVR